MMGEEPADPLGEHGDLGLDLPQELVAEGSTLAGLCEDSRLGDPAGSVEDDGEAEVHSAYQGRTALSCRFLGQRWQHGRRSGSVAPQVIPEASLNPLDPFLELGQVRF